MTLQGIGALVQLVRQQINTEGLKPVAKRTGIPIGQLRSFVQGRASRHTTLQSIDLALRELATMVKMPRIRRSIDWSS